MKFRNKIYPAFLFPFSISVSNLGYTFGVYRSTVISVSDKVYEDL